VTLSTEIRVPYLRARTNVATHICVNVEMSRVHAYMRMCAHICFDRVGDDYQVRIWSNVRGPEACAVGKLSKLSQICSLTCYDTRLNDEICATCLADYNGTIRHLQSF